MADYYPLISRAVAGLRTATPEARQAIYDRARQALVGQLRTMDPPIPEEAIEREETALNEAVARTEADLLASAPATNAPTLQPAAPTLRVQPERVPPPRPPSAPPVPPSPVVPAATPAPAVAISPPPRPLRPGALGQRPPAPGAEAPRPAMPPLRQSADRPQYSATAIDGKPSAQVAPNIGSAKMPEGDAESAAASARVLPVAPTLKIGEDSEAAAPLLGASRDFDENASSDIDHAGSASPMVKGREDLQRPQAPRPIEASRPNFRVWIVALAALAAVVAIALTAWRLRDNPQDLARTPVATKVEEPAVGKIVERAGGSASQPAASDTPTVPTAADSQQSGVQPAPPSTIDTTLAANTTAVAAAGASPSPAVPVAQKAAILVDAPDEPQKVKTYVGTVVWRTEAVTEGQDQPIGTGIRADIDVPEAKTQLVMQIRKNTEAQFPASHTIELRFTVAADSPLGAIKQINVPQMRRQDMPTGDPLSAVPATITDNYFLVGLTRGNAERLNLELLQSREWFDIPMLLGSGKASKITFEKGTLGNQIFTDVLQRWKAQN